MTDDGVFTDLATGWKRYQNQLIAAIMPLSADQLALRAAPALHSIGELAAHIVSTRTGWTMAFLDKGNPDLARLAKWDRAEAERNASLLVAGLEASWQPLLVKLGEWTPLQLAEAVSAERNGTLWTYTRGWVVWHLVEHDLHHGGEISLTLGIHGLAGVDIEIETRRH